MDYSMCADPNWPADGFEQASAGYQGHVRISTLYVISMVIYFSSLYLQVSKPTTGSMVWRDHKGRE